VTPHLPTGLLVKQFSGQKNILAGVTNCIQPEESLLCSQEPALVHILSQMNPVHAVPLLKVYISTNLHLCLDFQCGLISMDFHIKTMYAFDFHLCCMSCQYCPPNFYFLVTFGEEYRL
jgi:hypothetical protein